MSFPAYDDALARLNAERADLKSIFDEAGPNFDMTQVKSLDGDSAAKVAEIQKRNEKIDELAQKVEECKKLAEARDNANVQPDAAESVPTAPASNGYKSFADMFEESDTYKTRANLGPLGSGPSGNFDVKSLLTQTAGWYGEETKATMTTAAGFAPDDVRIPLTVPIAKRPVELVDIVPKFATNQASITWMEQTTRTNAAAETSEGAAKPAATEVFTERTSVVRKIAVILPVTEEQLDDVPQMRAFLELDLAEMVRQRLSDQIASGDGSAPNLRGILNTSGIQTQAKGADPTPDAIYKAMILIMTGTGMANPDAVVMNPLDWQDVRLLRTADGIYIWGNPSEAGPERIWGLPVVLAQGMTQNTAVVGDWTHYSRLAVRKNLTVDIGFINDDFQKNLQTLRAEMRVALFFSRPAAFCSVTGV